MTNQIHPKDRGYTFLGVEQSVKIDFFTNNMGDLESNSIESCKKSSTGAFDECAYQKVFFFALVNIESNIDLLQENHLQIKQLQLSKYGCTVPWMPHPVICDPNKVNGTVKDIISKLVL